MQTYTSPGFRSSSARSINPNGLLEHLVGASLNRADLVVCLEHRHRAPDDHHVIPQGLDLGRQELVSAAEQVESVANHGGEQLAAGPREELFVRRQYTTVP